jgi:outer membrane protein TolC
MDEGGSGMWTSTVRGIALICLCAGLALPVAAGDAAPPVIGGELSLEEAVKLAMRHNHNLQAALQEIERANGIVQYAYGHAIPRVTVNGRYTHNDEAAGFEQGGELFELGVEDNYYVDLTIEQPLYQGGIPLWTSRRVSRLLREQADDDVSTSTRETVYAAVRAYYDVLLLQQEVGVLERFEELARTHLRDVEVKRKFGVASDFNVLRSRVSLSNATTSLISRRNALQQARLGLYRTLGVAQSSDVELTEEMAYRPVDLDESALIAEALASRTELSSAEAAASLQEESFLQARRERLPEAKLFFDHIWSSPDPTIMNRDDWGSTWRGGVSMSIPLFDLSRKGRVTQERATLHQQEIMVRDMTERVHFEVRAAILAVRNAAQAVAAQEKTLEQASEGLRLAEVGYREGTLDQVSVLEARVALTESQLLYYGSLHAHATARLYLRRAVGTLHAADSF